jgi:hypothetical protein
MLLLHKRERKVIDVKFTEFEGSANIRKGGMRSEKIIGFAYHYTYHITSCGLSHFLRRGNGNTSPAGYYAVSDTLAAR